MRWLSFENIVEQSVGNFVRDDVILRNGIKLVKVVLAVLVSRDPLPMDLNRESLAFLTYILYEVVVGFVGIGWVGMCDCLNGGFSV